MKVGVIGLGAISKVHLQAIKSNGQEIVALCDLDMDKCEQTRADFAPNARVYQNYKDMLDSGVEVVHICTPHHLHAEMIIECLTRNLHVLCEKPLAISFAQLSAIENAVNGSVAQLGVCFQNRYNAAVLYVKDFFKNQEITSAVANLSWCRDESYYAHDSWRGTLAQEGGGVMINQAIHSLDLLQWICGMPKKVSASVTNHSLQSIIEVEDTAFGMFDLPNGGNFIISATNAAKHSFPIFFTYHTQQDTVEMSGENLVVNGKFVTKEDGLPLFGKEEWGVGHLHLITDFYRCLLTGEKFPVDFYEGQKAVRLVLKMYQSKGKKIDV